MVANRVSYHLDITGPSVPTDTACSSTSAAFHLACNSLRAGDCEAAIVGGCQLNLGFVDWFHYSEGGLLANDGKCKPFDASANGFSRGEAVVAIVLKPLDAAIKDNDHIYATVIGTGLTATGSASPLRAPVAESQSAAMRRAFQQAEVRPQDVDFVECHGTGTAKGDPEEANWVIDNFKRTSKWWFGSVKGNVGHTEITAFLASLSKVISILEHGVIPPNVNLRIKNPAIKWDGLADVPVIPTRLVCPPGRNPLIALASTGLGGVNGHAILEGFPQPHPSPSYGPPPSSNIILLTVGGLSPRSAGVVAESVSSAFRTGTEDQRALAYKCGRRTRQMTWRSFVVADPVVDEEIRFPPAVLSPRTRPPLVFIFSGQGPQHPQMGCELFDTFPAFRESILESDRAHKSVTGKSLIDDYGLFRPSSPCSLSGTWPVQVTLPALAAFQMALHDLLLDVGIKPNVVLGHSAGETAVLYASGAGSKAMAMDIAIARGQAFSCIEHQGGTMAALSCNVQRAEALLAACAQEGGHHAEIACYNAPDAVAISGDTIDINSVLQLAASYGIAGRRLKTDVPIHSSMMELCSATYQSLMNQVFARYPGTHRPTITTYSPTTGSKIEAFDAQSFWQNARLPVQFTASLANLRQACGGSAIQFVEASPHPVLSSYVSTIFQDAKCIFPGARRPRPGVEPKPLEQRTFLELVGGLFLRGWNDINLSNLYGITYDVHHIHMDPYPFQPKSFPIYAVGPAYHKQIASHRGPLNHPYLCVNHLTHPSLAEHGIRQQPAMPASGFLEMGFEFGASVLMEVKFHRLLSLSSVPPVPISVRLDGLHWSVSSKSGRPLHHSSPQPDDVLHADGFISFDKPCKPPCVDLNSIWSRLQTHITGDELYSSLKHLNYGPSFQRVIKAQYSEDEALVMVRGRAKDLLEHNYVLHPAIIDACIHMCCFVPFHGNDDPNVYYLPDAVGVAIVYDTSKLSSLPEQLYSHCILRSWTPNEISYNVVGYDELGEPLFSLSDLKLRLHLVEPTRPISARYELSEELVLDGAGVLCTPNLNFEPLWNPASDISIHFIEGVEADLRWRLSGLESTQMLSVWVTAISGSSGDKATGIVRALVKEYPTWKIRLALFDPVFDDDDKRALALCHLPVHLGTEGEFTFAKHGNVTTPRLRAYNAFLPTEPPKDVTSLWNILSHRTETSDHTKGLLVAALAPSLSVFRAGQHLSRLRILLTHSESGIGRVVSKIYRALDVDLTEVPDDVTVFGLYQHGPHSFDVVVSGHTDPHIYQISSLLLRTPHSRIFFWNYGPTSLELIASAQPYLVDEALECGRETAKKYLIEFGSPTTGAKHIVVTSRSGISSLDKPGHGGLRRLAHYLYGRADLHFSVAQFDASDQSETRKFMASLTFPLGGCFLMSNNAVDVVFSKTDADSFLRAYGSTEGVVRSLMAAVDVSTLEFLVAISSISALFGIPGQSAYAASKLVLDGLLKPLANASSFVCPPVAGTALVNKVQTRGYMSKWSITIQDYLVCLEDIITLIHSGQRKSSYIPEMAWNDIDKDIGVPRIATHLLYAQVDEDVDPSESNQSPNERLSLIIRQLLDVPQEDLSPEVPLTSFGLDSISASRLSLLLRTEFSVQFDQIRLLANATLSDIKRAINAKHASIHSATSETTDTIAQVVAPMLRKFLTSPLKPLSFPHMRSWDHPKATLVTGTTGALGSHLLQRLVKSQVVKTIYCLNRRQSIPVARRQREGLRRAGIPESVADSPKVVFIDYEPDLPMMGLDSGTINTLRSRVTQIVHNAWKSDFSSNLTFYEDILATTRSLLNIACTSQLYARSRVPVAEEFISEESLNSHTDVKIVDKSGYIQSKWVAEELVRRVGEDFGFRTCVIRAGVLSGASNGSWDTSQWFPSLVKSALYLKCLPTGQDTITWIPIDTAADVIVEVMETSVSGVIHVVHPRPTMWSSVIAEFADALDVPLVAYDRWFKLLEQDTINPSPPSHPSFGPFNPAIPLLDFFRQAFETPRIPVEGLGLTALVETRRGQAHSLSLRNPDLARLGRDDAKNWLAHWRAAGFLPG
ncbi:hypothetical protein ONZ45_g4321 [Pleurotus djamor]|nr:hypothetical protein ONZ45_g4321 [Pleurotus djamor]